MIDDFFRALALFNAAAIAGEGMACEHAARRLRQLRYWDDEEIARLDLRAAMGRMVAKVVARYAAIMTPGPFYVDKEGKVAW